MEKNTYIKNGFVSENTFRTAELNPDEIPSFQTAKKDLPLPHWAGHDDAVDMYWKAWEIGFSHLKAPTAENGFLSSYLDTAYNGNIFMWDSVFITHFSRYGKGVFPFQKTLDNFYRKQHLDGFICREIYGEDGRDAFQRHDPASTGPNILGWSEMEYYRAFGDLERLNAVYPALCAYHLWLKENRTWKDGSYWTSGWGSGMDNIPRIPDGRHPNFSHGHMAWVDACLQQYMNGKILLDMGFELERWQEIEEIEDEIHSLGDFIRERLWDEKEGFLFDLYADDRRSECRHIGALWALHAGVLKEEQLAAMVSVLQKAFDTERPFPSLDPGHPRFRENGRYWQGGVWAPTNYMVLSGLQKQGRDDLAHSLALKHHRHILNVYRKTGTFWEYYSPGSDDPGFMARPDFVGWTGIVPVSVLFEFVMGIRPDYSRKEIFWNLALEEEHGIASYPFGPDQSIDLKVSAAGKEGTERQITVKTSESFTLVTRYRGTSERHDISRGSNKITLKG